MRRIPGPGALSDRAGAPPAVRKKTWARRIDGNRVDMAHALPVRKVAPARAIQMPFPFIVLTPHGVAFGEPGDWLLEGAPGDRWPVEAATFSASYEVVEGRP